MSLPACVSKVFRHSSSLLSKFSPLKNVIVRSSSLWEPDYLILGKTKTPEYDLLNVQLKGYDFAVLENYQKLIKRIAAAMKINIVKTWPAPQQDLVVHHYKPNSSDIEYKYDLKMCERNIQIVDVRSTTMALFIEAVLTTCPPGVNLSIHEHENHMEEDRYVPILEIKELEEELESPDLKKKKKKNL